MRRALRDAEASPEQVGPTWDLHATAPPGIFKSWSNVRSIVPAHVLATAHKGTFGHGMGVGGGWS